MTSRARDCAPDHPLRVLSVSGLYPSTARPGFGTFVEERLRQLLRHFRYDLRVVAPIAAVPLLGGTLHGYRESSRTAASEVRHGIPVVYPRYWHLPGLGMRFQPRMFAQAVAGAAADLGRQGWRPDVLDAHYLYPDGVAVAGLARDLGCPYVLTARGTDVNVIANLAAARTSILRAASGSVATVAVSEELGRQLRRIGVAAEKLVILRNGVDLEAFSPGPANSWLPETGVATVLSVGNLIPEKGHDIVIRAVSAMSGVALEIIGEGRARASLQRLIDELSVGDRVKLLGRLGRSELIERYRSAAALLLISEREGLPNVVLEAMACGLPVVATPVGGIPEVVDVPRTGELVTERTPAAVVEALRSVLARQLSGTEIRRHAEQFGWSVTVNRLGRLLESAAGGAADA